MANNVVLNTIQLTGDYQPLAAASLVATVTLSAPPANTAPTTLRTPDGSTVELVPGEWHTLERVDLARLEAKGEVGDVLSIVGGSW
ncbi:MAG: hypothetical protein WD534_12960 [Phycisphaeraceae bacterium]